MIICFQSWKLKINKPVNEVFAMYDDPKLKEMIESCEVCNAVITDANLFIEDHGFLTIFLHLDLQGGCSQGFGGYVLSRDPSWDNYEIEGVAGHFIFRTLQVVGVKDWRQLVGKSVRIYRKDGLIVGIGHIIKSDYFFPKLDFDKLNK